MADVFGFKIITQYERGIVFRWGRALPGIRPEAVGIEDAPPDALEVPVPEVPALAVPAILAAGPAQNAPLNGAPKTPATV